MKKARIGIAEANSRTTFFRFPSRSSMLQASRYSPWKKDRSLISSWTPASRSVPHRGGFEIFPA